MRHRKRNFKNGKTSSHCRCMIANMLKSLVEQERIVTTTAKAKELRSHADKLITLAKKNTLASRRTAISKLMVRYNALTPKEKREAKEGKTDSYNTDRMVIGKLFDKLGPRFENRAGGYTRLIKAGKRVGDNADRCVVEYLAD